MEDAQGGASGPQGLVDDLPDRSIVTVAFAHRRDDLDVDVLIRADGNGSPLSLSGFPPRHRTSDRREVVLIDFGDEGDDSAWGDTRRRLDAYRGRGWKVDAPGRWHRDR